jgi:PAS domain S-box-containing protein
VDGIISADHRQNIVLFSRGAEVLFGGPEAEMQSRPLSVLFVEGETAIDRLSEALDRDKRLKHFEAKMLRRDGSIITAAYPPPG